MAFQGSCLPVAEFFGNYLVGCAYGGLQIEKYTWQHEVLAAFHGGISICQKHEIGISMYEICGNRCGDWDRKPCHSGVESAAGPGRKQSVPVAACKAAWMTGTGKYQ